MSFRFKIIAFSIAFGFGCGEKTDECMSDSDCADGQVCVISHDHEGDDHMMDGYGMGMGFGGIGMLLILILVGLAIAALIKYLRS